MNSIYNNRAPIAFKFDMRVCCLSVCLSVCSNRHNKQSSIRGGFVEATTMTTDLSGTETTTTTKNPIGTIGTCSRQLNSEITSFRMLGCSSDDVICIRHRATTCTVFSHAQATQFRTTDSQNDVGGPTSICCYCCCRQSAPVCLAHFVCICSGATASANQL